MYSEIMSTPIGEIYLQAVGDYITGLYFCGWNEEKRMSKTDMPALGKSMVIEQCKTELNEYFAGERFIFDVKIKQESTEFRKKVWETLLTIPYGQTKSYKEIAMLIGNLKAVRAVGGANHNNTISIIVPCHRVIGTSGSLTGYGGGIKTKEWLLAHEKKFVDVRR